MCPVYTIYIRDYQPGHTSSRHTRLRAQLHLHERQGLVCTHEAPFVREQMEFCARVRVPAACANGAVLASSYRTISSPPTIDPQSQKSWGPLK